MREYCGHGIGRIFHEDPQVLHYGERGRGMELQPGMTFTVEPMVNAGKRHVRLLPDGWTVITKDHSLSAQWEHTVLVTETRLRSTHARRGRALSAHRRCMPVVTPEDLEELTTTVSDPGWDYLAALQATLAAQPPGHRRVPRRADRRRRAPQAALPR